MITKKATTPKKELPDVSRLARWLPWILIICGVIGVIASLVITQDKFELAANPHFQPICDLNPIISCGSVMQSAQAHTFGFMNPYIGLIGFPVVVMTGVAMLAGARFKRWYWLGLQVGLALGTAFAYWLLWQSIYRIHALCPWCLSVDVVITTALWYVTLFKFGNGYLSLSTSLQKLGNFARRHHLDILIFWFVLVIVIILNHFWYYFGPHLFHVS